MHRINEQKDRTMATIPQDAQIQRRELVMLSMQGGQKGMQSAIAVLIAQGPEGESEAAALMRNAAHHFTAAAVLLDRAPSRERTTRDA